jgi:acyl carrier protein
VTKENSIKISKFHIDDGGLLLISEADNLPFLVVDAKGVTFDAGPFAGFFCALEGLSKFIVNGKRDSACFVQLKFTEEDVYQIGNFDFSDEQYTDALHWVITGNKQIAQKRERKKEDSKHYTYAVISVIATCLGRDKKSLKPDTTIRETFGSLDSLDRQNLIYKAEERFSIIIPDSVFAQIGSIADMIDYVKAQVENETDFLERPHRKDRNIRGIKHEHTAEKLLQ